MMTSIFAYQYIVHINMHIDLYNIIFYVTSVINKVKNNMFIKIFEILFRRGGETVISR